MHLYIQVPLFIGRPVRSLKKTSLGGGGGGILPVVSLTECKAFILNLHAGTKLITVTFDHFPV